MIRKLFFIGLFISNIAIASPYTDVIKHIDEIMATHPDVIEKFELGQNDRNETIWGYRIGALNFTDDAKEVMVVGVHHGNERLSAEVSLAFIEQAVSDILSKTRSFLASNMIYHVIPVMNINGYNRNRREEKITSSATLDPNRDYPDPCGGRPFRLKSTKLLAEYLRSSNIVSAVTIHGYIGTFTFPWGTYTSETQTEDHSHFMEMATAAANINNYSIGTHADTIYPTVGAFEDWAYHELGIWVSLIELTRRADVDRDAASMMAFFEKAPNERSNNHEHLGDCSRTWGPIRARP